MTNWKLRVPVLAIGLALAMPALAQATSPTGAVPPAGQAMRAAPDGGHHSMMRGHGGGGMGKMRGMFDALSPEGRKIMAEAMASAAGDRRAQQVEVRAARDRMMAVLEADRLDTAALKRAMDEEQVAANGKRDRMQAAMIGGFTKLTVTDRKAFVAYARAMKNRMEARMEKWQQRRGMGGMDDTPPPM